MAIQRTVTRIVLSLVIALACAGAATASEGSSAASPSNAGNGNGTSASASLGFRIVIPEVLRLQGPTQHQHVAAAKTSRIVTVQGDRQLVTLVRL